MKCRIFIIVIVVLLSVSCAGKFEEDNVIPAKYVEKVDSISDLMQTDPALGLLEGGVMSCGSVSATNSFAWLADNGYKDMVLRNEDGSVSYAKTAQAMDRVLKLSTRSGALPPTFLRGVVRYLKDQGYTDDMYRLEYQGWLSPGRFEGKNIPDLNAVKKGLIGDSAVWLLVGFYKFDEDKDEYQIISHHYVTLVGYGVDENGKNNPDVLIVHDPAPRSGSGPTHNYVHIEEIEHGQISVDPDSWAALSYSELPVDANGFYKLGEGLAYNDQADVAILDGVVILEMK